MSERDMQQDTVSDGIETRAPPDSEINDWLSHNVQIVCFLFCFYFIVIFYLYASCSSFFFLKKEK